MPKQLLSLTMTISCRSQVYIGITHEVLEPRNIVRAREGGFCLIDFSESKRHTCKGSKVHGHFTHLIDQAALIPKTDVFRTANIAKLQPLCVNSTEPSEPPFQPGT